MPGTNGTVPSNGQWLRRGLHRCGPAGWDRASRAEHRRASTLIEYYDVDDKLIFSGSVPASPGDGSLSFFGIVFEEAIIARVRITTGNVAPGPDDDEKHDIVMMDDFSTASHSPFLHINGHRAEQD